MTSLPAKSPADWADLNAWDDYHRQARPPIPALLTTHLRLDFVASLTGLHLSRIWFPGSGTSLAPRVYAELGFDVLSTDFSAVAVEWQQAAALATLSSDVLAIASKHKTSMTSRPMRVRVHDFRTSLDGESEFDAILNMRAIQGLSSEDIRACVAVHFAALRRGGHAIFDTLNVQGEKRDDIEGALRDAGFAVPFFETNKWHRGALHATGISYVMILGRPVAHPDRSPANQSRLDELAKEYRERGKAEAEATRSVFASPDTKIAHVVYSTG